MKIRFKILLSVLAVAIWALGVHPAWASQTTIETFPELKFMELLKDVNPKDPYKPIFRGLYEDSVTVKGRKRTFKTYIPDSVTQGDNSIYVAVPSGVDTAFFLSSSGWKAIADKYKLYLFAFEPEGKDWNTAKALDEIDYISAVFNRVVNVRPYYNIVMGNYYFIGYGAGGTLLQMFIMANPRIGAGMVVFDGSDISEQYIKETGAKISDDPNVPLSKVKVPVWIISQNLEGNTSKVIDYWRNANDCTPDFYSTQYAQVYLQTLVRRGRLDNDQNVSKVLVSVKATNYYDAAFNEVVWKDFLSKTCRYGTGIYNNALRPYASFEDLGIKKFEINVDGYTRHWFEYVPSTVKTNPSQRVPLLVALHGSGQTGAIMVSYSEWYKVAEERGFIAVFPTGYPVAFPNAVPRPGWNLGTDINPVDDVKFINEIINNIRGRHSIDSTRVYITGQSFGSFMSYHLAMMSPQVFAAVGSTSGAIMSVFKDKTIGISNPAYKFPGGVDTKYEMPVWLIFGEKDLWGGGSLQKNADVRATMTYWIARNNAGDVNKPATYRSGIFHHQVWTNSRGVPMVRYSITQGRQHNCIVTEMWQLWDEFFSKFSRNANGEVEYMKDINIMK